MANKFIDKLDNASTDYYKLCVLSSILDRRDATDIIKEIFPDLEKRDYFPWLASDLFKYLIDHKDDFEDEVIYLMERDIIDWSKLRPDDVDAILSINGGIDGLIKHFGKLDVDHQKIVANITLYVIHNRRDLFASLVNGVVKTEKWYTINYFLSTIVTNDANFDYNIILEALRSCKKRDNDNSFSILPHSFLDFMYWSESFTDFLISNFEELFDYEKDKKIRFLEKMRKHLNADIASKYDYLLRIYKVSVLDIFCEESLNTVLKHKEEAFIKDYVQEDEIDHLALGTTLEAFKVGDDKVLKFIMKKYSEPTIMRHFLFAPTERKTFHDEKGKPILYLEQQGLLLDEYNGVKMNDEDLDNYFKELAKYNLRITDPHCMARDFKNFGFLRDYHDATLVGVSSYEELPEWFKRRPVVLLDIDLIEEICVGETLADEKRKLLN